MDKNMKKLKSTAIPTVAVKPELAKTDAVKTAQVRTEPARTEPAKSEPAKTLALSAVPVKTVAAKPNRVCLELVKPGAKKVCVAGSFNDWKPERTPLAPLGNGRWVGDLSVKPGRHEYLFVVDGQWVPDPNAKETVQNPFGGKNSVLLVSE